jgi:hypothetical protein
MVLRLSTKPLAKLALEYATSSRNRRGSRHQTDPKACPCAPYLVGRFGLYVRWGTDDLSLPVLRLQLSTQTLG